MHAVGGPVSEDEEGFGLDLPQSSIQIEHFGKVYQRESVQTWRLERTLATEPMRAAMDEIAATGTIYRTEPFSDDRFQLEGSALQRVRARLLGLPMLTRAELPTMGEIDAREPDWLIPDLWPLGHVPVLGGNAKAGKTTLVADLAATLTTPGRRFLNFFEPANLHVGEESPVWIINAETPRAEFLRELQVAGIGTGVVVDHLEELGGPETFDITDPVRYAEWAARLVSCDTCDGSPDDDVVPSVVLVDGVTAILEASGKGPAAYSSWYAAFRRLVRELGVSHGALAVVHNVLRGGHSMGGTAAMAGPDGLWSYSMDDVDRLDSPRRFSAILRAVRGGIPRGRVRFNDEGRLELTPAKKHSDGTSTGRPRTGPKPEHVPLEDRIIEFITKANAEGNGPSKLDVRAAAGAASAKTDAALAALEDAGRIKRRPRGRGYGLWLTTP